MLFKNSGTILQGGGVGAPLKHVAAPQEFWRYSAGGAGGRGQQQGAGVIDDPTQENRKCSSWRRGEEGGGSSRGQRSSMIPLKKIDSAPQEFWRYSAGGKREGARARRARRARRPHLRFSGFRVGPNPLEVSYRGQGGGARGRGSETSELREVI